MRLNTLRLVHQVRPLLKTFYSNKRASEVGSNGQENEARANVKADAARRSLPIECEPGADIIIFMNPRGMDCLGKCTGSRA